ncbi:MAG: hypothetical protein IJE71_05595 [Clostridia bacterium]|nr:hypothetical protein [Clostridia bacterium]
MVHQIRNSGFGFFLFPSVFPLFPDSLPAETVSILMPPASAFPEGNGCFFLFPCCMQARAAGHPMSGGDHMSPKELLYIEDALGHEKFLIAQCHQAAAALQDPALRSCAKRMEAAHRELFSQLYMLV